MGEKAALISIHPKWVDKILNGKKTVEVRKTRPKIGTPFKCYIYCTKGDEVLPYHDYCGFDMEDFSCDFAANMKVVAEFTCDRIRRIVYTMDGLADVVDCETSGLSPADFIEYGKGKPLYGWHISGLKVYDKPKKLEDFGLKRPPQSWCHVEETG